MTPDLQAPRRVSFAARVLLVLVRGYQIFLSPMLGGRCRFEPSCSRYAAACLALHGAGRGSLLSIVRLCKCHPFHPGGFDPPPAPSVPRNSDIRDIRDNRRPELTPLERNLRSHSEG